MGHVFRLAAEQLEAADQVWGVELVARLGSLLAP